jgi:hypothetical protein
MRKKVIYLMSIGICSAGLMFGMNNYSEAGPPNCKNGIAKGNQTLGVCYGSGPDCFRCKIFAPSN